MKVPGEYKIAIGKNPDRTTYLQTLSLLYFIFSEKREIIHLGLLYRTKSLRLNLGGQFISPILEESCIKFSEYYNMSPNPIGNANMPRLIPCLFPRALYFNMMLHIC